MFDGGVPKLLSALSFEFYLPRFHVAVHGIYHASRLPCPKLPYALSCAILGVNKRLSIRKIGAIRPKREMVSERGWKK